MPKVTITPISSTISNTAANTINNNLNAIADAIENTVSRDGSIPNQMEADLDLNHNDLINVGLIDAQSLLINGESIEEFIEQASQAAEEAQASAESAAESAQDAIDALSGVNAELLLKEDKDQKGIAGGYAPIGPDGKIPSSFIPEGGSYLGIWDADTNTPTITAGVGNNGDFYAVAVAGTQSISGSPVDYFVGDQVRFNNGTSTWERIPSNASVIDVAGKTGNVVLVKADVGLGNVDNTSDLNKPVSTAQQTALNGRVPTTRTISTGTGLQGGGALSADLTLSLNSSTQTSLSLANTALQPSSTGLGINVSAPALNDLNDQTALSGFYRVLPSTIGDWPSGVSPANGTLEFTKFNSTAGKQILTITTGVDIRGREFVRTYDNSTWRTWSEVLSTGNIRSPLTVPVAHFERSIPLNLWEMGVYGSDSTPTVDETAGIQAAIDRAIAEKRDLVVPARNYLTGTVGRSGVFQLRMYGVGGKPFFIPTATAIASGSELFSFRRPNGSGYTFLGTSGEPSSDIILQEDNVVFGASLGVAVGDYVGWTSDKEWYYDGRGQWWKGEFHEVGAVSGSSITFKDATWDAYDVSAEVLTVSAWVASRLEMHNLGFGDVTLNRPAGDGTGNLTAISANRCKAAVFDDIETYNFEGSHLTQRQNDRSTVNNFRCYGSGPISDTGYGLGNLGVINSKYTNIIGGGTRRLVDFLGTGTEGCGPSRNNIVDGFIFYGGGRDSVSERYMPHGEKPGRAVGTHGPAENITFKNGRVSNTGRAGVAIGRNIVFDNIHVSGWISEACFTLTYGEGGIIQNCSYTSNDYGKKEAQGVAIDTTRRCPDFIKMALDITTDSDGNATRWDTSNLQTIIKDNSYDGLTRSFINLRPGQAGTMANMIITNNKGLFSTGSEDTFSFIRNDTGGSLSITSSELFGNEFLPRGDNEGSFQYDWNGTSSGTVFVGVRVAGSPNSADRWSKVGPNTWRLQLPDDTHMRIRAISPYASSAAQKRVTITGMNGDATVNFDGWIAQNSSTPVSIYTGSNINFTATPTSLNGTNGTDGKATVGLTSTGDLWIENRRGGTRVFDITIT